VCAIAIVYYILYAYRPAARVILVIASDFSDPEDRYMPLGNVEAAVALKIDHPNDHVIVALSGSTVELIRGVVDACSPGASCVSRGESEPDRQRWLRLQVDDGGSCSTRTSTSGAPSRRTCTLPCGGRKPGFPVLGSKPGRIMLFAVACGAISEVSIDCLDSVISNRPVLRGSLRGLAIVCAIAIVYYILYAYRPAARVILVIASDFSDSEDRYMPLGNVEAAVAFQIDHPDDHVIVAVPDKTVDMICDVVDACGRVTLPRGKRDPQRWLKMQVDDGCGGRVAIGDLGIHFVTFTCEKHIELGVKELRNSGAVPKKAQTTIVFINQAISRADGDGPKYQIEQRWSPAEFGDLAGKYINLFGSGGSGKILMLCCTDNGGRKTLEEIAGAAAKRADVSVLCIGVIDGLGLRVESKSYEGKEAICYSPALQFYVASRVTRSGKFANANQLESLESRQR
jgi:hypothetical protein